QDALEVTVLTNGKDKDGDAAQLPVEDATVTAGGTTATTDGSGRAVLQGYFGDEPVKVSKIGFKSQTKQIQFAKPDGSGKPTGSATFILQPIATEDSIDVN